MSTSQLGEQIAHMPKSTTSTAMLAFHGDAKLKKDLVAEIKKHQKADQIVQGTYGEIQDGKWKGCAVGCSIHSLNIRRKKDWKTDDHSIYPEIFGVSERMARLQDSLFEGLPAGEGVAFVKDFWVAIPVGADLSRVIARFCEWLLIDPVQGVIRFAREQDKKAIKGVAELHAKEANGKKVTDEQWSSATSAAWSAAKAASAAWSAASATSAAWSAAKAASAAWSATSAKSAAWSAAKAASAARSAAWSTESAEWRAASAAGAASAAWRAERSAQAKKLIELLKDASVPSSN